MKKDRVISFDEFNEAAATVRLGIRPAGQGRPNLVAEMRDTLEAMKQAATVLREGQRIRARALRGLYDSLIEAGFTEDQALALCRDDLKGAK